MNARLRDVTIQGGTSTGNVVEDECGVVAQHPEIYIFGPLGRHARPFLEHVHSAALGQWPQAFCHRESGWQTNFKGLATYTVPKIDVLISGTFHSLPYPGNNFPTVHRQSLQGQAILLFTETSLGRPFAGVDAVNGRPRLVSKASSSACALRLWVATLGKLAPGYGRLWNVPLISTSAFGML